MEQFDRAEKKLINEGFTVINPAKVNGQLPTETDYEDYMKLSMCMLSMCQAIYMIPGWEKSCGANREYGYALGCGMDILSD